MQFTYKVANYHVIDGDSVRCKLILKELSIDLGFHFGLNISATRDKVNCRIQSIDAPERNTDAGKAVAQVVFDWLSQEKDLWFVSEKLDKYGRALGYFTDRENDSLPDFLLDHGLARPYDGGKREEWTAQELWDIEERCSMISWG